MRILAHRAWRCSHKIKELNRFIHTRARANANAIKSLFQKSPGRIPKRNMSNGVLSEAKRSREVKQKEESSCLFDGAIKGLFMFIFHLKRSHKTSDCTHKPSAGYKSCHETESVFESHLDSDMCDRSHSLCRNVTVCDYVALFYTFARSSHADILCKSLPFIYSITTTRLVQKIYRFIY